MKTVTPRPLAVDVAGAAELLGVSMGLVRKLTLAGEIPSALIGTRRVYPVVELEHWLAERTQQPGAVAMRVLGGAP